MKKNLSFINVCLLFFPLVLQAQTVTNQRVYDTIPFMPEHTAPRLAQFEKEPVVTGRVNSELCNSWSVQSVVSDRFELRIICKNITVSRTSFDQSYE